MPSSLENEDSNTNARTPTFSLRSRKLLQELQHAAAVGSGCFFLLIVILCETTRPPRVTQCALFFDASIRWAGGIRYSV
jgi:hypothetical protein